jgi:hypothetical protein
MYTQMQVYDYAYLFNCSHSIELQVIYNVLTVIYPKLVKL